MVYIPAGGGVHARETGSYTITLTVTDEFGVTGTATYAVSVS